MELPLASLFEASTVAGLAGYLQRAHTRSDPLGEVLPLRVSHRERPLFCIHPAVGLGWAYTSLLRHLDDKLPVYALQSSGLRSGAPLPGNIAQMAADHLAQIRRIQPEGPYRLLGWSLGGLVAHEMAAQLQARGQQVECLALLDAYPFVVDDASSVMDPAHEIRAILRFLGFHQHAEHPPADLPALIELLCKEYGVFDMPFVREISRNDPQLIERVAAVTLNNLQLARRHVPRRIDADVLFFRAALKEDVDLTAQLYDQPEAWRPYVDGWLEMHDVACHHQGMLDADAVAQIARTLMQRLHALTSARPPGRPAHAMPDAVDHPLAGSLAAYA
jgi:enterobactin synthetase component F